MINVVYAECHLCCVTYKPFILSVDVQNVIGMSVVVPIIWVGHLNTKGCNVTKLSTSVIYKYW